MAHSISCDICQEEQAAQLLTSLETGATVGIGPACLPVFYAQTTLELMDAGEHKGLPQRCQACRRVHERVTLAARPGQPTDDVDPGNVKDQAGPHPDDGISGNKSAGALTQSDLDQLDAAGEK